MSPPVALSLSTSLGNLVASMKPTYFPPLSSDIVRIAILSDISLKDPFMIVRTGDTTLLVGTGYDSLDNAGKSYPTFPDMRLIQSEKDHIAGWILLESGFDITSFQMMLEMLGFPFVYGTRDVIAYIRDNVKEPLLLDKYRFFELFTPGVDERKISDFVLKNTSK
jgi:hypothetical protein